jgi:hypothetical protein
MTGKLRSEGSGNFGRGNKCKSVAGVMIHFIQKTNWIFSAKSAIVSGKNRSQSLNGLTGTWLLENIKRRRNEKNSN